MLQKESGSKYLADNRIKVTPMLRQYFYWKERYPDCLLFFRMGDFYELFFEDAEIASRELDITLTSRDKEKQIPMAGVPHHSADLYIKKLISKGYKVAICEQLSEPDGRNIVERKVIRVITPGTYVSEEADYEGILIALNPITENLFAVAVYESASSNFSAGVLKKDELPALVYGKSCGEVLIPKGMVDLIPGFIKEASGFVIVELDRRSYFSHKLNLSMLKERLSAITLKSFGIEDSSPAITSAGALWRYLEDNYLQSLNLPSSLRLISSGKYMQIDITTQENLEIFKKEGLLDILDRTVTKPGKRLLKNWFAFPLLDVKEILNRQKFIKELKDNTVMLTKIRDILSGLGDYDKSISRMRTNSLSPKDLVVLRGLFEVVNLLKKEVFEGCSFLKEFVANIPDVSDLYVLLKEAIADNPPKSLAEGGVIKEGYNKELDSLRQLSADALKWLEDFAEKERKRTGIKSLKIGYNKVFGYYIEISKSWLKCVPDNYVRKQTLVNAERFTTKALKELESKLEEAAIKIERLESEIFNEVKKRVVSELPKIERVSYLISKLDVLSSLAFVAFERNFVCPEVVLDDVLVIKGGRHPVVEFFMKHPFVPNDVILNSNKRLMLLTGPNMAGKSTYLRMCAVIAIMAQVGSFVPAEYAKVGIIDKVFTRIGARDDISRGRSTFMVEMTETAHILNNATSRSLILLDEIGRGTSTYDGMSIAWAVLEYLASSDNPPKVLFATHYHELTELAGRLRGVFNMNMAVSEDEKRGIVFLYKVKEGPADKSYGIEVAKLAGLPQKVIERAYEILKYLEEKKTEKGVRLDTFENSDKNQLYLFDVEKESIIYELASCDPDNMTPLEALDLIYKLNKKAKRVL